MGYRTISRALAMVALTLGVVVASQASADYRPQDRGGRIDMYAERIAYARGVHRIDGDCYSACSMWLGYRRSCITRDARVWFHGAYEIGRDNIVKPDGNAYMAAYYPPQVKRIVSDWLGTTHFSRAHTLTGAQLIAMGMRPCR